MGEQQSSRASKMVSIFFNFIDLQRKVDCKSISVPMTTHWVIVKCEINLFSCYLVFIYFPKPSSEVEKIVIGICSENSERNRAEAREIMLEFREMQTNRTHED